MNGDLVEFRTGVGSKLVAENLDLPNAELVRLLFLGILSRYPTADELSKSLAAFSAEGAVSRYEIVQDLVWSLYNKVDFIFNY